MKNLKLVLMVMMLGGCAVGPNFVRPIAPSTNQYTREPQSESTVTAGGEAQNFKSSNTLGADWWKLFGSSELDTIVDKAISNNPTLQASEATLRQSQDNMRSGYGVFFPQIQAGAGASRQRPETTQASYPSVSVSNVLNQAEQVAESHSALAPLVPYFAQAANLSLSPIKVFNLATLSTSVSYAMDVFGGARRSVESLRAQAEYQRCESVAAFLVLTSNVVNTSIARAAYLAEIHTTQELIKLEQEQLELAKSQFNAGLSSYSNVLSIESMIAINQASLAPLKQYADRAEHLLATLEGQEPSKADLPDTDFDHLSLPVDLPISLPSELVRQRPDILAAEAQMHAASAQIGVATALMLPSFSLDGTFGVNGSNLRNLTSATSKFWSIGPTVTIPLFQGTTLWYGRRAAIDAFQQSRANYRVAVLSAFAQVADSLNALEHDAEALKAQDETMYAARETFNLLQANYHAGLISYSSVLTANVQFHEEAITYLQAVAQRYQDTVALFVALGGGWWSPSQTVTGA